MTALRVTGLYHYPVKSCRGIALNEAQLTPYGLAQDRYWMVVDQQGRFLTQRRFPRMALIEALPEDDGLLLKAPGLPPLSVPPPGVNPLAVRVWGFDGTGVDAGDTAAAWLSAFLNYPCRLAAPTPALRRAVDPHYDTWGSEVMYSDGFPLLLISEASLESLNARLAEPVPMNRFRPNLVIAGCEPHAEDGWRTLQIGAGLIFHVVKPCARCTIPTVDQMTGVRGNEPSATLATYRKWDDNQVYFGQNVIHESKSGLIKIGDSVTVLA